MEENRPGHYDLRALLLGSSLLGLVLVVYSQTLAFAWDVGFHLLAAQLIRSGKRPYLDFVFAQTPLNAYWNAAWMWMLGERWRAIQAIDALLTTAAVALAADFLRSRSKAQAAWRTPGLIAVLVLAGGNSYTVEFGTIGQAYALGLLLIVAAFRLTAASVSRGRALWAGLAGLLSGAAAGSTLLTAPAAPVLLIWLVFFSPAGRRLQRGAAFVTGVAVSLLPLLALFAQSPARVMFGVFRYHMFYRRSDWPGATRHDLEVFVSWIGSPQALVLGSLAAAGLWFVAKKSGWDRGRRAEFYLCGWLALAVGIYVSTAHPTFPQYYVFTIPFLAILSSLGLLALAAQLGARRALWPALGVSLLMCLGLAKTIYDKRDEQSWPKLEGVAHKVDEVTAPGAALYADEPTYFLTRRIPPPGNEYISSHKLRLPAAFSEMVHIVPQPEFDRRIQAGMFDTVETCEDEDWRKERKLAELYRQKAEIADCAVFWDRAFQAGAAKK